MRTPNASQERDSQVALFDALFEAHRRAVHAFHLGRTANPDTAADLLQETFLRAWRNIETLIPLSFEEQRFWLFRCARNLAIDHHRRTPQMAQELNEESNVPASNDDPAQAVETQDLAARVQREMNQLPPELREVLTLQAMGGLNSTEISRLLNKPAGTVRYQISQARRILARRLELE
jgi:RNA polymerase sigma-70 factor (ECF subfamily)